MPILLGIDTGGTYTDAVLFDDQSGVISSAKALTTKHNLSIGIREAMEAVLPHPTPEISLVSLSTTLATNAIVEGQGSSICSLLLGYSPDTLKRGGLGQALGDDPVVFIDGGHTVTGEEQMPLDLEAARQAILKYGSQVAAFAVSGYFAVLNPAHELAVRDLIRELTGLPVTCGHELTSHLHAPRRALTAALNARLISLLQQLILAVKDMLAEKNIQAPLMVVKGDGSLVNAQVALERPVETILSGPAASVVGARYLSGQQDVFVVDMGGTTTDIALLRDGRPVLNVEGATVGGWQTMVEAIAVHTSGLGGDSEVRWNEVDGLVVGPRRVVPLSLMAYQHPAIVDVLQRQLRNGVDRIYGGQFLLRQRPLDAATNSLTPTQLEIWDILAGGPVPLVSLLADPVQGFVYYRALNRLIERGLAVMSSFTPTDAAHVLGYHQAWHTEAARLGAELHAQRLPGLVGADEFSRRVIDQTILQLGRAAVAAALTKNPDIDLNRADAMRRLFIDQPLAGQDGDDSLISVTLTLSHPLVAIGAPVATYYPTVAERLHTRLHIPQYAEIANAVGAVVGSVMQTVHALIKPLGEGAGFRVHLPIGIRDFGELEAAAAYAIREAGELAESQARRAGAVDVQFQVRRRDNIYHPADGMQEDIYLETEITATAVGRPRLAEG
jgi:N-methylhydantoinase A/oxoprolinase/acetone carboxylase beta subunit